MAKSAYTAKSYHSSRLPSEAARIARVPPVVLMGSMGGRLQRFQSIAFAAYWEPGIQDGTRMAKLFDRRQVLAAGGSALASAALCLRQGAVAEPNPDRDGPSTPTPLPSAPLPPSPPSAAGPSS